MMEMTLGSWRFSLQRIPPSEMELATMYDTDAWRWHQSVRHLGYLKAYADLFERLRQGSLGHLPSQSSVLDCGIGTAGLSLSLVQTLGTELRLDGVDISLNMLGYAQRLLESFGVQATLHHRNAQQLPFDDQSFDLVMSAHMLEHVSDPLRVLGEMVRVLRPGAPLLLVISQPSLLTYLIQLRWRHQTFRPSQVMRLMTSVGLDRLELIEFSSGLPRQTSFACIGLKLSSGSEIK